MTHPDDVRRALEAVLEAAESRLERLTGNRHAWRCLEAIPAVEWSGPFSGAGFAYESEVARAMLGEPDPAVARATPRELHATVEAWTAAELAAMAHAALMWPPSVARAALVSEIERHQAKLARLAARQARAATGRLKRTGPVGFARRVVAAAFRLDEDRRLGRGWPPGSRPVLRVFSDAEAVAEFGGSSSCPTTSTSRTTRPRSASGSGRIAGSPTNASEGWSAS
jgi:hypothetical protein